MNEEFIEAHKDEIEQLDLISGSGFDDDVEMLNRAMAECKYDPPPKKSYMHYVAPVVSHNFRRVQHRG